MTLLRERSLLGVPTLRYVVIYTVVTDSWHVEITGTEKCFKNSKELATVQILKMPEGWCLRGRLGKQNNKSPGTKNTQTFGDAQENGD